MLWFRNLHPALRLGIILVAAALPFAIFALIRADRPPQEPLAEPVPTGSPDTPLAFPFGTEPTTTTSTLPVDSTPTTRPPTRPQCSDGRDNDRDGRIDLRDPGCRSRSDNSEFNAIRTTTRPRTTRPPTTTRPPATTTRRTPATTNSPTAN